MPAEWAPHTATWLAYPHHRTDFPGKLAAVAWTFAEMARVITQSERVELLCRDRAEAARAKRVFGDAGVNLERVGFHLVDTNRSWTRDSMPIWVREARRVVPVKFRFDGWSRYRDYQKDDRAGQWVAKHTSKEAVFPRLPSGERVVLEGGSIDVDGAGTLLTTSECLLHSPRARFERVSADRAERQRVAEGVLREYLGAEQVIWLPDGIVGDDTSGHVDDFARFVPGGRVVVASEARTKDANHGPLLRAKKALVQAKDARGKRLEVIELPMPKSVVYRRDRLPASYANFYIANSAVLVPVFNDEHDRIALDVLASCFTDRPVVGIYARDLVVGLGTLHCSSMQQPR